MTGRKGMVRAFRGCDNCNVQRKLKNDFICFDDVVMDVKRLRYIKENCVNCVDNDYATKSNWRPIRKPKVRGRA